MVCGCSLRFRRCACRLVNVAGEHSADLALVATAASTAAASATSARLAAATAATTAASSAVLVLPLLGLLVFDEADVGADVVNQGCRRVWDALGEALDGVACCKYTAGPLFCSHGVIRVKRVILFRCRGRFRTY